MKTNSWKTTVTGICGALLINVVPLLQTGSLNWQMIIIGVVIAVISYFAKDWNVSGTK